jgi:cytochrome b6-f complex iron-sulfur subunit
MGNWRLTRFEQPTALTREALIQMRMGAVAGLSRRQLLRRSIGAGMGLWFLEVLAGTLGFLWPNLSGGFGGVLQLGDYKTVSASPAVQGYTLKDGAPSYFLAAKTYIAMLDPTREFTPGDSPQGDGAATNARTLYQRCTHLGCKPNFCPTNFWFECPCHGSRYDRLGIKVLGLGPAPRSLDRFASKVDAKGVLTVDTGKLTLGPLPVALGQPGVVPPKSPTGCI